MCSQRRYRWATVTFISPNHLMVKAGSTQYIRTFLNHEASGGIILMVLSILALVVANSPLSSEYFHVLHVYLGGLSVLHWINDGLMAVFFLLVGLEIKREALEGQLSTWSQRALPGMAALGGVVFPALVYLIVNRGPSGAPSGWAIPAATDIAFALGVLSLLGKRVPASLKIFLTALAIIDDLVAVLIIALFYTAELKFTALYVSVGLLALLIALNCSGVTRLSPYLAVGGLLWYFTLKSGIHATVAGVLLALTIPLSTKKARNKASPLQALEHALHPWVTFIIIPIFGFANAGVSFSVFAVGDIFKPVPLGVALGLFLGKQIGVFAFSWLAIRTRLGEVPEGANWIHLYGMSLLCGIGFTMSLFIGLLAFADSPTLQDETKLGVIVGSFASAIVATAVLWKSPSARTITTGSVT